MMDWNGLLIVDKPAGWTSHDVVGRLRRILGEKSIGHLGTLDPMATGILPLVVGRWTRLAQFFGSAEKTYTGRIRFGFSTTTYDAEGDPTCEVTDTRNLDIDRLRRVAAKFTGTIMQTPPPFSAKKIGGVPAYKLARKQAPVELKAVEITINSLELDDFRWCDAEGATVAFRVEVSSGTYIRSIAHEIGHALGCGAHLCSLRRTRFADFTEADAHTLETIEAHPDPERVLVHPRRTLPEIPCVTATTEVVSYLGNGRAVNLPEFSNAPLVKVFAGQTELIAICQRLAGTLFKPKVVLKTAQ
jgi:tRNA pseudouridine55 synthase